MSNTTLTRGGGSTALIDPRLRDRRLEVARDEGRRRRRRLLWVALLVLLVAGAVAATRSPLLDVDQIVVRGAEGARADEVRAASGIALGDALTDLDPAGAARRIEEVAWVADASVTRRWPDAVEVRVEARTPVAVVGSGSGAVAVDRDGRAIAPAAGFDDLPTLDGAAPALGQQAGPATRAAAVVVAALPPAVRAEVATAGGSVGSIELELRDGIVVAWGDDAQQSAKADALTVLLDQDDRATFARIDVTVPRAATVTFRDVAGE